MECSCVVVSGGVRGIARTVPRSADNVRRVRTIAFVVPLAVFCLSFAVQTSVAQPLPPDMFPVQPGPVLPDFTNPLPGAVSEGAIAQGGAPAGPAASAEPTEPAAAEPTVEDGPGGFVNPTPPSQNANGATGELVDDEGRRYFITYKTPWEFYLVAMTVTLGVLVAAIYSFMLIKKAMTPTGNRTFLLILVVFGALFLIVAGYSDDQLAPVFALLGSIVGYLFGRSAPDRDADDGSQQE